MKNLDIAEFEALVREFKEDLQREVNQNVLKREVHQAAAGLYAMEAVDRLSHRVQARAFYLGEEPAVTPTNVAQFPIPAVPVVRKRRKVSK